MTPIRVWILPYGLADSPVAVPAVRRVAVEDCTEAVAAINPYEPDTDPLDCDCCTALGVPRLE